MLKSKKGGVLNLVERGGGGGEGGGGKTGPGLYMAFRAFKFGQDHPKYYLGVPRAFHMYIQPL